MKKLLLLFIILIFFLPLSFAQTKGHLVIIGGGDKPVYISKKIYDLAGVNNPRVVIIPNASAYKKESVGYAIDDFKEAGFKNIDYVMCDSLTVDADSNLEKLNNTNVVYFCGGDQTNLTRDLLGSKLLEKIKQIYKSGGVVCGTSAGAAVMSKVMLTGNELVNKDSTRPYNAILKNNIETLQGFGFVTNAIIDQHFLLRKRNNRLISVVLAHPDLVGFGIDQSTSIIVNPDNTIEVLGESLVMVYDATKAKNFKVDKNEHLSASNLRLHILSSGEKYNLNTKEVIN